MIGVQGEFLPNQQIIEHSDVYPDLEVSPDQKYGDNDTGKDGIRGKIILLELSEIIWAKILIQVDQDQI